MARPRPWMIRATVLSEPMRRPAGSAPHVEDMRDPSESRYGLFERVVSSCNDVGLLAEEYEAEDVRRLHAPRRRRPR
jgi:hypothetical protein